MIHLRKVFKKVIVEFLRIFLHLLYTRLAFLYDWVAYFVSAGRWQSWVCSVIPLITRKGTRILELGYGPGHLQRALLDQGVEIYGLDASFQMAHLASKNIMRKTNSHNQTFQMNIIQAQAEAIPFPDQSFTSLLSTFPSPYIFNENTLKEAKRLLAPDGQLIILLAAESHQSGLFGFASRLLFKITQQSHPSQNEINKITNYIKTFGFLVNLQWIEPVDSELLVILATKV